MAIKIQMIDPPVFDAETEHRILQAKQDIEAHPRFFDGHIYLALREDVDNNRDTIRVFPAKFSHKIAGVGYGVGVMGMIRCRDKFLFSQRSYELDIAPGEWSFSAAGAWDVGESPLEAITREMEEEIGVSGLPLIHIKTVVMPELVYILFRAEVDEKIAVFPNAAEVKQCEWRDAPDKNWAYVPKNIWQYFIVSDHERPAQYQY